MKRMTKINSILTTALALACLTLAACDSADTAKQANNSVQEKPAAAANSESAAGKPPENAPLTQSRQDAAAVEIYDGRDAEPKNAEAAPTEEKLVEAEFKKSESAILKSSKFECDEGTEDGVSIIGTAEGSFTKPASKQKAFLYERCRAGRSFGIGGILVAENDKVAAHYAYGENGLFSGILSAPDVDKNGLTEIILVGGGTGQGYTSGAIDFFEFKGENLNFLGRAETFSDNSGAVENAKDAKTIAYKIFVEPAANPDFSRETYRKDSGTQKWNLTEKSEKTALEKKDAPRFTKIN